MKAPEPSIPYLERKEEIRTAIEQSARAGRTIYYSDLGRLLGLPERGPWKPILDFIGLEERKSGRPDLTVLVVSKSTGFPSQINFLPANPPSEQQRKMAEAEIAKVLNYYSRS